MTWWCWSLDLDIDCVWVCMSYVVCRMSTCVSFLILDIVHVNLCQRGWDAGVTAVWGYQGHRAIDGYNKRTLGFSQVLILLSIAMGTGSWQILAPEVLLRRLARYRTTLILNSSFILVGKSNACGIINNFHSSDHPFTAAACRDNTGITHTRVLEHSRLIWRQTSAHSMYYAKSSKWYFLHYFNCG